jgi:hypothetical protein
MVIEVLPNMVDKTREICVILTSASCNTCTCSFDLWMSCVGFDTFAIVMSFINTSWEPCHVTIGIFEVHNTISATMADQVKSNSFSLHDKVITYVKDEGINLNTLTFALYFVVSCFSLQLACPFVGSCFGHAMLKVAQYATNDSKMCWIFRS